MTQTLGDGYALNHVVMCMLSKDSQRLVARFCSNSDEGFLNEFEIDLREPNLFNRLLKAKQGLLVDRTNFEKV